MVILDNVKRSNIKYGTLLAEVAEEIPRNKLLVYKVDHTDLKNLHKSS